MKNLVLLLIVTFSCQVYGQTKLGQDIIGEAEFDWFGYDVDMSTSGDTIVVGAPLNDANGNKSGHVRVFTWRNSEWQQLGNDINGEVEDDRCGFSVAISGDGTRVVVGCPQDGALGIAKVYEFDGADWVQLGFDIEDAKSGDNFARSVDISHDGNTLAIGAPSDDSNGSNSGAVYTYEYNGVFWQRFNEVLKGNNSANFGHSIALSSDGSILAIGAPLNDDRVEDGGSVRVFQNSASSWIQKGRTLYGVGIEDDFGVRVRLAQNGDVLAVSAPGNDLGALNAGTVFVYEYQNDWNLKGEGIHGKRAGDFSGDSDLPYVDKAMDISHDGNVIVIGSPSNDDAALTAGQVRVFTFLNDEWVRTSNDIEGRVQNDQLGNAVSINGNGSRIAIGVRFDSPIRNQEGSVQIFEGVTITSVDFARQTDDYITYPNPTSDIVFINGKAEENHKISKVEVYDIHGRLCLEFENIASGLNLTNLQSGLYYLKLYLGEKHLGITKVVKKN